MIAKAMIPEVFDWQNGLLSALVTGLSLEDKFDMGAKIGPAMAPPAM